MSCERFLESWIIEHLPQLHVTIGQRKTHKLSLGDVMLDVIEAALYVKKQMHGIFCRLHCHPALRFAGLGLDDCDLGQCFISLCFHTGKFEFRLLLRVPDLRKGRGLPGYPPSS